MASHYWIKLYQEMLRDPKVGRLSDSAFRRFVELLLLAGENEPRDGSLPCPDDIAWQLRVDCDQLEADIKELERAGILTERNGCPFLVNFEKRQEAMSDAERMRRYRKRKRLQDSYEPDTPDVTHPVTYRNAETDKETDKETDEYIPPQEYPDPETEDRRVAIRTAILTQVKEIMHFDNEARFNSCADALIEMGTTAERVKGFGAWWKVNGHYKGKPALKSFMQNYKSYQAGETFSQNGQNQPNEPAGFAGIREYLEQMENE